MNNKQKGKKLEQLVVDYLKEIDPLARTTKNSGGNSELGDIKNRLSLKVECKKRNTSNLIINRKVWLHLLNQLIPSKLEIPLLVMQNKHEETFVTLDIRDFMRIFEGYYVSNGRTN